MTNEVFEFLCAASAVSTQAAMRPVALGNNRKESVKII